METRYGGDTHGRNGNAVCNLAHQRTGRGQSRGSNVRTGVAVNDHGGDDVHGRISDLQHSQRLGEVARILHFRGKSEEGHVSNCRVRIRKDAPRKENTMQRDILKAKTMLVTDRKAVEKLGWVVMSTCT